jgi:5''-phosphoribostamycin phosphatase/probable phosphoglycerate mutase
MRRALQTARALAQRRDLKIVVDDRLEEMRLARPLLPPLSVADWNAMLEARLSKPARRAWPGVETVLEQVARVEDFLRDRHASRGDENLTLVVSHAFTIEMAILRLLGLRPDRLARSRVRISNAALHVVENETLGGSTRLILVNAKNHLGTLL